MQTTDTVEKVFRTVDHYYYDHGAPITKGEFGFIFQAFDSQNPDGPSLIVKPIPTARISEDKAVQKALKQELDLLGKIRSDHVVKVIDVRLTDYNLYIFAEYCNEGSLREKLDKLGSISEQEALSILKQIAETFVQIQIPTKSSDAKKVLMHRNINPNNILFHDGKVKLSNFGFAKAIDDIDEAIRQSHTEMDSTFYSSPQLLDFEDYSSKCDIWSVGIVLYQAICGRLPWESSKARVLISKMRDNPLEFPKGVATSETQELIRSMLQIEEENRPSWKEVCEHPVLKGK